MSIRMNDIRAKIGADVPDESIKALLDLIHAETDALRDANDALKKELEEANSALETAKTDKGKAEQALKDFIDDANAKTTRDAKEKAYKALLGECGISEKRHAAIARVADLDSIELKSDGTIKGADKLAESIKTEWADFVTVSGVKGQSVATPPGGTPGDGATKESIMAIKDTAERHAAIAAHAELFTQ